MAKKEFRFQGKTLEEVQKLSLSELAPMLDARARRKIKRGFTDAEKAFLKSLRTSSKPVKTHCRDMIVLPEMVGKTIKIHRGNSFEDLMVEPEMIGHRFGEYVLSRKRVQHGDAGVGATKGRAAVSVR
ncbi:MAG: 30S ribosomal protein S19 [Nanoarchaeota archaeon]